MLTTSTFFGEPALLLDLTVPFHQPRIPQVHLIRLDEEKVLGLCVVRGQAEMKVMP